MNEFYKHWIRYMTFLGSQVDSFASVNCNTFKDLTQLQRLYMNTYFDLCSYQLQHIDLDHNKRYHKRIVPQQTRYYSIAQEQQRLPILQ